MSTSVTSQVAIFWDYENCRPPNNLPGYSLVNNILKLVQNSSPVKLFKAYVDVQLICGAQRPGVLQSELQASGVTLVHCPHNGRKDVADKMMIVDMLAFAIDNPAPATVVIITGDRDFAYATSILKLRGYKVVVICPSPGAHASLKMQANSLFDWQNDVGRLDKSAVVDTEVADSIERSKADCTPKETNTEKQGSRSSLAVSSPSGSLKPAGTCEASSTPPVRPSPTLSAKPSKSKSSLLNSVDPHEDDRVSRCPCSICARTRVALDSPGTTRTATGEQIAKSAEPSAEKRTSIEECYRSNSISSTVTPSSVSTDSSLSGSSSSTSRMSRPDIGHPPKIPDTSSIDQFLPLIEFFIDQRNSMIQFRSSIVASAILKRDPKVYKRAGVRRMKQYIEKARDADVIVSPEPGDEGDGWIEINEFLYSDPRVTRMRKTSANIVASTTQKPVENENLKVLIDCLRARLPSNKVLDVVLESDFKIARLDIYEHLSSFSEFLKKAKKKGIITFHNTYISDCRWVELNPAFRVS